MAARNAALVSVMSRINKRALESAHGSLLVHAGGVCTSDGGTAIICGPSGSGKSTLVAGLVRRGHGYVTDEVLCLRPVDLVISPYRKPLQLKRGSHPLFPDLRPRPGTIEAELFSDQWLVRPQLVGTGPRPTVPLLPEVLIFPTHVRGERLRIEQLSPAEAGFLVARNASFPEAVRGGVLEAVSRLARRAPAFRLFHDDHGVALDAVEELWASPR